MWPSKWVFIVLMLFIARTQIIFRNSPSLDEWAVVPMLTALTLLVLVRDVVLLLRRRDHEPLKRGLPATSAILLAAIATINTWTMLVAPSAEPASRSAEELAS